MRSSCFTLVAICTLMMGVSMDLAYAWQTTPPPPPPPPPLPACDMLCRQRIEHCDCATGSVKNIKWVYPDCFLCVQPSNPTATNYCIPAAIDLATGSACKAHPSNELNGFYYCTTCTAGCTCLTSTWYVESTANGGCTLIGGLVWNTCR